MIFDIWFIYSQQDLTFFIRTLKCASQELSPDLLKRELERFVIELAWKSSKIEGNTYSLLETESLIKEQKEAVGKSRDEAIMILK